MSTIDRQAAWALASVRFPIGRYTDAQLATVRQQYKRQRAEALVAFLGRGEAATVLSAWDDHTFKPGESCGCMGPEVGGEPACQCDMRANEEFAQIARLAIDKGLTTSDLALPPKGTDINTWIDEQVEAKSTRGNSYLNWVDNRDAAEIARGAALFVIADRETLIANLRKAGYVVVEPGSALLESDEEECR